jgi:hypothetical protein
MAKIHDWHAAEEALMENHPRFQVEGLWRVNAEGVSLRLVRGDGKVLELQFNLEESGRLEEFVKQRKKF